MEDINNIDSFPIAFYVIEDDLVVNCNLAAVHMFGGNSKEDIIGLRPYDLSPTYQRNGQESIILGAEYIKQVYCDKIVNFRWLHKKFNGDVFLAYINLIYINDMVFTLFTNIDEIQKLEDSVKEKDYMYKLMFQENKNIMYLIDTKTGNFVDANKACLNFYGYDIKTFCDLNITDINISHPKEIRRSFEHVLSDSKNNFSSKHKLANGEIRDVDISSYPIKMNNQHYLFSIITDITDKIKQNLMFNTFFSNSPYAIAILDNEQKVIGVNDKFVKMFQYERIEIIGDKLNTYITSSNFRDELSDNLDHVFSENFIKIQTIRKRKDQQTFPVEIVAVPITYENKIIGAYIHYFDMTQSVENEKLLQLFKKVLENSHEGIMITDQNGLIEWVNPAFKNITGYSLEESKGNTPGMLKSKLHNKEFYRKMWYQIINENHWHGEIWNKNKQGDIYPEWLSIYAVNNNFETTHYVGIFRDLSEMKTINQKMRVLAQKDVLTGLYNRTYFNEELTKIIKNKSNLDELTAILFIDLDDFKDINDSLGHQAGDAFIVQLSQRLLKLLTDNNLIARYGGDEFVILLQGYKTKEEITQVSQQIFDTLYEPFMHNGNYLQVSSSIGISLFPNDGSTCDELIQNADIAMYVAKNNDDKKIVYYLNTMKKEIDERFKVASLLRNAIINKEFTILYEPVYNVLENKMAGAEVILKWNSDRLQNISFSEYTEIVMKAGFINHLFESFLDTLFLELSKNKLTEFPISINLMSCQLEGNYIEYISKHLGEYNIDSRYIGIEFIECSQKTNRSRINDSIKELNKLGIHVTLDDFGGENSTLNQIKNYPINKIKMDEHVINSIFNKDLINNELVKTVRLISKNLNIQLVAKGINCKEHLQIAKELGFEEMQGNYFSKAVPIEELTLLLHNKKSW